jgi:hypothetical protein
MFSHKVGKLIPLEGLIDHLDQIGVLFFILLLLIFDHIVIFVEDVEHPLPVVLKLNKRLIDSLSGSCLLIFTEKLLKQEFFYG